MLRLPRFDYERPTRLDDAIGLLADRDGDSRILAGGTDLIVQMKKGVLNADLIVDIKSIPQLAEISLDPKGNLAIGANVTLSALEGWITTESKWAGLLMAVRTIGSEQVRNRATVAGNICRASPSGDMAPMLMVMDAKVKIKGPNGYRALPLDGFFAGPGQTVLSPGEIVTSILVPKPSGRFSAVYLKHGTRRAMDLAIVGTAVSISMDDSGKNVLQARIALGAVAPTPIRVPDGERLLVQEGFSESVVREIASMAADRSRPITDMRSTDSYRYEMVKVNVRRALGQAWAGAASRGERTS